MSRLLILTIIESFYLLYMFFLFKTDYSIYIAPFDKGVQNLGSLFVHDTGHYENKVCLFGRVMAVVAVGLGGWRAASGKGRLATMVFDGLCLVLAALLNMNAFVYLLPLLVGEIYIMTNLID
uniref:Uncharacterized protein n=1 Tax=viral metagenome TaxID=1070528 RepID=A0A6C0DS42_9ZZZZ